MSGYDIVVLQPDGTEKRIKIERSIYHLGEKDCDINFANAGFKGYGLMIKILGSVTITPGENQVVKLNGSEQPTPFEIGLGDIIEIGNLSIQIVEHGKPARFISFSQSTLPESKTPVETAPTEIKDNQETTVSKSQPPATVPKPVKSQPEEAAQPPETTTETRPAPPPLASIEVKPVVRKREAWESAVTAVRDISGYVSPALETQKLSKRNIDTKTLIPCEFCGQPIRPIVLRCPHCKNDRTEIVDEAFKNL